MEPQPTMFAGLTEGRIVHYVLPSGAHRPAIVVQRLGLIATGEPDDEGAVETEAAPFDSGIVSLSVFCVPGDKWGFVDAKLEHDSMDGLEYIPGAPYDEDGTTPLTWHWPERA